jgi:hypothetical protein
LFGGFANWYVNEFLKPLCDKNDIILHHVDKVEPFSGSAQAFVKADGLSLRCDYVTNDFTENWTELLKVNEEEYIAETKHLLNSSNLTLTQAKQIRAILNSSCNDIIRLQN